MRLILDDSVRRPELFNWEGPTSAERVASWLGKQAFNAPADLLDVWCKLGAGEMFETETLLAPFGSEALGRNLSIANADIRAEGMSSGYMVFHIGVCVSGIRLIDGAYITFDHGSFTEAKTYPSLDHWYLKEIRAEYSSRYQMADPLTL